MACAGWASRHGPTPDLTVVVPPGVGKVPGITLTLSVWKELSIVLVPARAIDLTIRVGGCTFYRKAHAGHVDLAVNPSNAAAGNQLPDWIILELLRGESRCRKHGTHRRRSHK